MLYCFSCEKNDAKANSRSHSNIATIRRQKVNLQTRRIDGKKVNICTRCLRTRVKATA
ncbi:50S ribosomal protein L28 [Candidatus Uhrbacteria bacterium]|nr:50S ribosomal protein L28 [Candidatus Uhrbacteria bacterium]